MWALNVMCDRARTEGERVGGAGDVVGRGLSRLAEPWREGASRERSHGFAMEGKNGASPSGNVAGDADPRGSNDNPHNRKPSPR